MWISKLLSVTLVAMYSLRPARGQSSSNSSRSQCSRCIEERSKYREMTKYSIRDEILRKLRFSSVPNVTDVDLNSNYVRNMVQKLERESGFGMMNDHPGPGFNFALDEDDFHFQPSNVIIPASEAPLPVRNYRAGGTLLYFKMSQKVIDSRLNMVKSELTIHLPAAQSSSDTTAHIHIHSVSIKNRKSGVTSISKVKKRTVVLSRKVGGMVRINLDKLTRNWLKNPSENLGIVIRVITDGKREVEIGQMGTVIAPYLQVDIRDGEWRSRTKRTANRVCSEEYDPEVTQCCMWPLTIDFDEFGWDWVVLPRSYEANFCSGDCSLGAISEYPHGTLMQIQEAGDMANSGLHSSAGPCCAPRKMSSINMLYLDQDKNVILGTLPNMKVMRCGCS